MLVYYETIMLRLDKEHLIHDEAMGEQLRADLVKKGYNPDD